ncbi:hypothetical protein ACLB2K_014969 [Fragaria x ananassa]
MSWQQYVDEHLMCDIDGNALTAAAILGQDGSIWSQSSNFPQFKPEEIAAIMKDFDQPGTLAPTGLFLGGTKYMVIQGEAGAVIRGKKGSGGVTVKKTNQALIIGSVNAPEEQSCCCLECVSHLFWIAVVNDSVLILQFIFLHCSASVFTIDFLTQKFAAECQIVKANPVWYGELQHDQLLYGNAQIGGAPVALATSNDIAISS